MGAQANPSRLTFANVVEGREAEARRPPAAFAFRTFALEVLSKF
jgi:hypothetical protein